MRVVEMFLMCENEVRTIRIWMCNHLKENDTKHHVYKITNKIIYQQIWESDLLKKKFTTCLLIPIFLYLLLYGSII